MSGFQKADELPMKCFVCDETQQSLSDYKTLIREKTDFTNTDLASKIGSIVGDTYEMYVSTEDKICFKCVALLNQYDELEDKISVLKYTIMGYLNKKYHLNPIRSDSQNKSSKSCEEKNEDFQFECVFCEFKTDTENKLKAHVHLHLEPVDEISSSNLCNIDNDKFNHYQNKIGNSCNKRPSVGNSDSNDQLVSHHLYSCSQCDKIFLNSKDLNSHFDNNICNRKLLFISSEVTVVPITKMKLNIAQKETRADNAKLSRTRVNKMKIKENAFETKPDGKVFAKTTHNELKNTTPLIILQDITVKKNKCNEMYIDNGNEIDKLENNINAIQENHSQNSIKRRKSDDSEKAALKKGQTINTSFKCSICKFYTVNENCMRSHIRSHLENYIECTICKRLLKNKKTFKKHLDMHSQWRCGTCDKEFPDSDEFYKHIMSMHVPAQSEAKVQLQDDPNISHKDIQNLDLTVCLHCGLLDDELDHKCNTTMQDKHLIKSVDHEMQFYTETLMTGLHTCKFCNKNFEMKAKLIRHEKRHARNNQSNLMCKLCPKKFSTQQGLTYHKIKHTGKYKAFCDVCGRGFNSVRTLDVHMAVHTKEERYVCDICDKRFCFKATYRMHRLWHDNPLPYECKICKKKFSHTSMRAVHMRRDHTGEKPYQCNFCNKKFLQATLLKNHMTIHTKIFAYNCDLCARGFTTRLKYATHLAKSHNDPTMLNQKRVCQYKMAINPRDRVHTAVESVENVQILVDGANQLSTFNTLTHAEVSGQHMNAILEHEHLNEYKYEVVTDEDLQYYIEIDTIKN